MLNLPMLVLAFGTDFRYSPPGIIFQIALSLQRLREWRQKPLQKRGGTEKPNE
jgi:hypothetical protein